MTRPFSSGYQQPHFGTRLPIMLFMAIAMATNPCDLPTPTCAAAEPENAVRPDLRIGNLRVGRVLFLGNSITLHGPSESIDWLGNWGMAASAADKDYVHLLTSRIAQAAGAQPQTMVKNIADFERQHVTYDLRQGLQPELDFAADLVILAIGENVPALTTDEAKANYRTAFARLLAALKQHGQPALFVRGSFWADKAKDEIMKQACDEAGGVFVDIRSLDNEEANFARSEREFKNAGVAIHPGDRGMAAISTAIWKSIEQHAAIARQ